MVLCRKSLVVIVVAFLGGARVSVSCWVMVLDSMLLDSNIWTLVAFVIRTENDWFTCHPWCSEVFRGKHLTMAFLRHSVMLFSNIAWWLNPPPPLPTPLVLDTCMPCMRQCEYSFKLCVITSLPLDTFMPCVSQCKVLFQTLPYYNLPWAGYLDALWDSVSPLSNFAWW